MLKGRIMDTVPAVELQDVGFSYNGVPVLEDVSFSIGPKEFYSVVGPNGGGKTTLIKIILGLLRPSTGRVRIFGRSPERSRERMGYMPQHTQFDPQFPVSVLDVVLMGNLGLRRLGPYRRRDREEACRVLDMVDMCGQYRKPFSSLSGGQRQRVLLARALMSGPEILLLDEPTANVDVGIESKLDRILRELRKHMTILMVTHDLGFVTDMVERVICVNRKVVIHPTSSLNGKLIHELYETDMRLVQHNRTAPRFTSRREERPRG
jgi:zinc transport system ATP-binding protein